MSLPVLVFDSSPSPPGKELPLVVCKLPLQTGLKKALSFQQGLQGWAGMGTAARGRWSFAWSLCLTRALLLLLPLQWCWKGFWGDHLPALCQPSTSPSCS